MSLTHREYPIAGRVGSSAGEAYQAGTDPHRELEFGLARILDGVEQLVAARKAASRG